MKNLKLNSRNELTLKGGAFPISGYIELENDKVLSYEERLDLIKKNYDWDLEFSEEMAEDAEYAEQKGKALIFFENGLGVPFTKEEAEKLDELIG